MYKNKLLKNIKEMELNLEEMKKELAKEEKPFPQKGDEYYFIDQWGVLNFQVAKDNNGRFQVFKTKDEARNFYNVECARKRVKDEIKRLNDGWTPDWTNSLQLKYYVYLFQKNGKLEEGSSYFAKIKDNCMYLKSAELVNELVKTHKQDLLLILGQ